MRRISHRTATAVLIMLWPLLPASRAAAQDGSTLEHCDAPVGTLAVVEPQNEMLYALQRYSLQSPTALLRIMVQESNCFRIVDRGVAMQNMRQERELAAAGELQQGSNMGKGQMRTADYVLTPTVLFANNNAGGVGGGLGGIGRHFGVFGAAAGALKFKEAETTITISDARTSEQVAAAQGKARQTDFRLGMLGWGGGAVGALGGYTNTPEGKVVAASFLDNYNHVVTAVRADPSLKRAAPGAVAAAGGVKAGMSYNNGDVLGPKIAGVKLLASPDASARAVGTLGRADEVVFLGEAKGDFLKVQGASGEGMGPRDADGEALGTRRLTTGPEMTHSRGPPGACAPAGACGWPPCPRAGVWRRPTWTGRMQHAICITLSLSDYGRSSMSPFTRVSRHVS